MAFSWRDAVKRLKIVLHVPFVPGEVPVIYCIVRPRKDLSFSELCGCREVHTGSCFGGFFASRLWVVPVQRLGSDVRKD